MGRAADTKHRVKTWAAPHIERADESIIGRYYNRLLEVEFIDRSVAMAAKLFIAFFPFVVAIAAFSPEGVRESMRTAIIHRFGLEGESMASLSEAFGTASDAKAAIGVVGLIFLLLYATSFTTALQRTFLKVWRRPGGGGWRNQRRGILWITGMVLLTVIAGTIGRTLTGWQSLLGGIVLLTLSFFLWWWTSWLMLRGEVKWRPLLPGAVLSSVALALYVLSASIWMPPTLENNQDDFGAFGVTLSLVTYFVGVAFVVIMASTLSPILAEGTGTFAVWLRGGTDTALTPGAKPALPGPTHRLRIADALGLPSKDGTVDQSLG